MCCCVIDCSNENQNLSAGETVKPNGNYTTLNKHKIGYEKAHNTRVDKPYFKLKPELSPDIPVQLRPHSRLVLTDVEDRPFFDVFAWQTFIGLVWPVDSNLKGVPNRNISKDEFLKYNITNSENGNRTRLVWQSFKSFDEALPNNKECELVEPKPWKSGGYNSTFYLDKVSKTKHGSLDEAFSSPLIDQNHQ